MVAVWLSLSLSLPLGAAARLVPFFAGAFVLAGFLPVLLLLLVLLLVVLTELLPVLVLPVLRLLLPSLALSSNPLCGA